MESLTIIINGFSQAFSDFNQNSVSTCAQKSVFTFDKTLNIFFLWNILAWTVLTCSISFVYQCSKFSKLIQPIKHELLTENRHHEVRLRMGNLTMNELQIIGGAFRNFQHNHFSKQLCKTPQDRPSKLGTPPYFIPRKKCTSLLYTREELESLEIWNIWNSEIITHH